MNTYKVWCPDRGQAEESAREIKAYDREEAVEKWARWYDSSSTDYSIASGNDGLLEVRVLECKEGARERIYKVGGEMVAWYTAEFVGEKS